MRVHEYSFPKKFRKTEAWLRRIQKYYGCIMLLNCYSIDKRVLNCNCLYKRRGVPLFDFWNCKWCCHKTFLKVFLIEEETF